MLFFNTFSILSADLSRRGECGKFINSILFSGCLIIDWTSKYCLTCLHRRGGNRSEYRERGEREEREVVTVGVEEVVLHGEAAVSIIEVGNFLLCLTLFLYFILLFPSLLTDTAFSKLP